MRIFSHITLQDKVDFAKNLSIMLMTGIPINEALKTLAEQTTSPQFCAVIKKLSKQIENGTPLSDALAKEPRVFDQVFVGMVRAGEASGTLQNNLEFLAVWFSRSADLKREVSAAMLYPKLVFGASFLLGGALAVFILPRLVPLFASLHVELPIITRILLAFALFLQNYWYIALVGVVLLVILIRYTNRIERVRSFYHTIFIRMPFLGALARYYQLALVTELSATLLRSGLSLNETMRIVSRAATNVHYMHALEHMSRGAEQGSPISESMVRHMDLFPQITLSIVSVGERSGTLVRSFEYLSEFYTKEVNALTKKLPTIIEPILLILIAVIVGFVALAIIMPIYELTGSLSR